ncbi:hypothetical protein CLAFUW4_03487 [Fulvia fulva]|uniref:BRCT domain-containing protein n=1 Tax=Passalora fulva TaxID=5499 RepID=A0A9Q8LA38_PASFU|nr:uncharacterized protein CLAFUR5_03466 [Fulvia fulva]KAK4631134.1 hypothetical protein CLAFUR4_03476 [Fulvia fulva]KAK4633827.1 hypothetical protein CLAFUR0_03481 [Fulvia fulva]UJO13668.1 hypothetical protein CLAFUR5_03466 [Fulvia fulva]WPV11617.1 hypothetical protein CLAFUW4_03487 [Fulvia fulva]WPV25898.1 hypothetical protein CLAFUW7_03479 [Fulvia fulva]
MAPPRSVFLVTRRDFTSDSEGRLEVLEAFATRDAATEAAEAHGEEEDAEVKFEVTELAAASKVKTKKTVAEDEEDDDQKPAPSKKAAAEKSEKKAIPKGKADSLQGLKASGVRQDGRDYANKLQMTFTGTFKSMDRKTCEATAKVYGADIVSDKKLAEADLIVVGERPGTKKVDEIKEKSLKTINEAEELQDP